MNDPVKIIASRLSIVRSIYALTHALPISSNFLESNASTAKVMRHSHLVVPTVRTVGPSRWSWYCGPVHAGPELRGAVVLLTVPPAHRPAVSGAGLRCRAAEPAPSLRSPRLAPRRDHLSRVRQALQQSVEPARAPPDGALCASASASAAATAGTQVVTGPPD